MNALYSCKKNQYGEILDFCCTPLWWQALARCATRTARASQLPSWKYASKCKSIDSTLPLSGFRPVILYFKINVGDWGARKRIDSHHVYAFYTGRCRPVAKYAAFGKHKPIGGWRRSVDVCSSFASKRRATRRRRRPLAAKCPRCKTSHQRATEARRAASGGRWFTKRFARSSRTTATVVSNSRSSRLTPPISFSPPRLRLFFVSRRRCRVESLQTKNSSLTIDSTPRVPLLR